MVYQSIEIHKVKSEIMFIPEYRMKAFIHFPNSSYEQEIELFLTPILICKAIISIAH